MRITASDAHMLSVHQSCALFLMCSAETLSLSRRNHIRICWEGQAKCIRTSILGLN